MTVIAAGSQLNYLWYKDGLPLPSATNATFVLTNASSADQGTYAVLVGNPSGVVASAPAVVTVGQLTSAIGLYAGITVNGIVGSTVSIQYTTNLDTNANWITLTRLTLTNRLNFGPIPARRLVRAHPIEDSIESWPNLDPTIESNFSLH